MIDETDKLDRNPQDIQTCSNIMRKHTNITDRHIGDFSQVEERLFGEKMRRVSVEMIEYYYWRMSSETQERARKTLAAIGESTT